MAYGIDPGESGLTYVPEAAPPGYTPGQLTPIGAYNLEKQENVIAQNAYNQETQHGLFRNDIAPALPFIPLIGQPILSAANALQQSQGKPGYQTPLAAKIFSGLENIAAGYAIRYPHKPMPDYNRLNLDYAPPTTNYGAVIQDPANASTYAGPSDIGLPTDLGYMPAIPSMAPPGEEISTAFGPTAPSGWTPDPFSNITDPLLSEALKTGQLQTSLPGAGSPGATPFNLSEFRASPGTSLDLSGPSFLAGPDISPSFFGTLWNKITGAVNTLAPTATAIIRAATPARTATAPIGQTPNELGGGLNVGSLTGLISAIAANRLPTSAAQASTPIAAYQAGLRAGASGPPGPQISLGNVAPYGPNKPGTPIYTSPSGTRSPITDFLSQLSEPAAGVGGFSPLLLLVVFAAAFLLLPLLKAAKK